MKIAENLAKSQVQGNILLVLFISILLWCLQWCMDITHVPKINARRPLASRWTVLYCWRIKHYIRVFIFTDLVLSKGLLVWNKLILQILSSACLTSHWNNKSLKYWNNQMHRVKFRIFGRLIESLNRFDTYIWELN